MIYQLVDSAWRITQNHQMIFCEHGKEILAAAYRRVMIQVASTAMHMAAMALTQVSAIIIMRRVLLFATKAPMGHRIMSKCMKILCISKR